MASDWTSEIVNYLTSSDALLSSSMALTAKSITAAKLMAIAIFPLSVGYSYIKNIFNNSNQKAGNVMDVGYFFKAIIIYALIGTTPNILELIAHLASYGIEAFSTNSNNIAQSCQTIYESAVSMSIDDENTKVGDVDFWFLLGKANMTTLLYLSLAMVAMVLCILVRVVMTILTNFVVTFLFIVSPFSMAFSLIPGMENTFMHFLKYFLSSLFVFLTMNILDQMVFNATISSIMNNGGENMVNPIAFILFCVVVILMYLLVFWLTTMYVGVPSAGQAAGMVGALATMGAGAMIAGASKAGGAVSSVASSSGSASSAAVASGKDALGS